MRPWVKWVCGGFIAVTVGGLLDMIYIAGQVNGLGECRAVLLR